MDNWNDVIIECSSLASKWEQVSGYLGLSIRTIDTIKGDHPNDTASCLNEALKQWILQNYNTKKFSLPSWRTLLQAIGRVDKLLFRKLTNQHEGRFSLMTKINVNEHANYYLMSLCQVKLILQFLSLLVMAGAPENSQGITKKCKRRKRKKKMDTIMEGILLSALVYYMRHIYLCILRLRFVYAWPTL